ncbi:hypothetical protein SDC9_110996 [bioreactor metagenome]|uniref:Uncharacterized protein n=1 Tax=bioreactor metagenome TaxID=1076179 RepID=A0A645BF84_9ZZZZ
MLDMQAGCFCVSFFNPLLIDTEIGAIAAERTSVTSLSDPLQRLVNDIAVNNPNPIG